MDVPPRQPVYLGNSTARRLLKRSQYCKKGDFDEPIFALHEEGTSNAATPYEEAAKLPTQTGSFVRCYASHLEDEAKRREAGAVEKEKSVLLKSINSSRRAEGILPLQTRPELNQCAQDYADMLCNEEQCSVNPATFTTNSVVVVMSPSGSRAARLVSPPRMGALACGEMWHGGKYKRHLYSTALERVRAHPDNCPCHLRIVFETMVDEGWNAIGVGRGEDGRWVVELGQ